MKIKIKRPSPKRADAIRRTLMLKLLKPMQEVTPELLQACREFKPGGVPVPVPVRPDPASEPRKCHDNVYCYVQDHGGQQAFGWDVWEHSTLFCVAQAHSVWDSGEGLVDITPNVDGDQILFLPDAQVEADLNTKSRRNADGTVSYLPSKFFSLRPDDHDVTRLITLESYVADPIWRSAATGSDERAIAVEREDLWATLTLRYRDESLHRTASELLRLWSKYEPKKAAKAKEVGHREPKTLAAV